MLQSSGHEVLLAATDWPVPDRVDTGDLRVALLPTVDRPLQRAWSVRQIADSFLPELVVAVEAVTVMGCLIGVVGRGTPVVSWIHAPRVPWYLPASMLVFVASPALFAFSQRWRRERTRLLPAPGRIVSSPTAPRTFDSLKVLTVSRLVEPYKGAGLLDLIRAFEHLGAGELTIVGEGPFRPRLEAEAMRVNDSAGRAAVRLVGAEARPHERFAATSLVVGSGLGIVDAVGAGLPAVVLGREGFAQPVNADTIDELMRHGFYGAGGNVTPLELARLLTSTWQVGHDSDLVRRVRERYAPESVAASFMSDILEDRPTAISSWRVMRALLGKLHYRLRRRLLVERFRRTVADLDRRENEVNRRMREYAL